MKSERAEPLQVSATTTCARPPVVAQECCNSEWEAAYRRFETPAEEIRKFTRRLEWLGAADWPRDARVVELFCGRGNGLVALERMGFTRLEGVDLSPTLLAEYQGAATCHVADCRRLPFEDGSKDMIVIQGGLHHLPVLPDDLVSVLEEVHRVLAVDGRLAVVEPWLTPFLRLVHCGCRSRLIRRLWPRVDALATMIEHEIDTYRQWLGQANEILRHLQQRFRPQSQRIAWGKLNFLGVRR